MNLNQILAEFFQRLQRGKWSKPKRIVIMMASAITALLIFAVLFSTDTENPSPVSRVSILPKKTQPAKKLDYDFIKLDTLQIPNFPHSNSPEFDNPNVKEPLPLSDNSRQTPPPRPSSEKPKRYKTPSPKTTIPKKSSTVQSIRENKNPNMIVMNNMLENPVKSGSAPGVSFSGESTLVKVVLLDKTSVSNGSLIEARVIHDARWAHIDIPRRSKVIGIANMFNGRVNIDFQELVIDNVSHPCRGRAFDLKQQLGLPYSTLQSDVEDAVSDEMRSAVIGVPVVGRMANRSTLSRNLAQESTELDEGLEFYALISSVR